MNDQDKSPREGLPIPDKPRSGLVTYDAKDPENKYPKITPLRPPAGAPNILLVLIDDAGFGSSSTFGGPCNTLRRNAWRPRDWNTPNFIPRRSAHRRDRLC